MVYLTSVTLCSNASLDAFPDNRPTAFANILPERLTSSDWKKPLFIRPLAISLATGVYSPHYPKFNFGPFNPGGAFDVYPHEWQFPGYIEIGLKEASSQVRGSGYHRCLAGFPFPPSDYTPPVKAQSQMADFSQHRFRNVGWTKLKENDVAQLSVELTSTTGHPFLLHNPLWPEDISDVTPTVLELEVTDDEEMAQASGIVTIACSSWQPKRYYDNTHAAFTSPLPHAMVFADYEVALSRIVYPPNLRQGMTMRFWINDEEYRFDALKDFGYNTGVMVNKIKAAIAASRYKGHINCAFDGRVQDGTSRLAFTRSRLRSMRRVRFKITLDKYFRQVLALFPDDAVFYMEPEQKLVVPGRERPDFRRLVFNPTALLECDAVNFGYVGENQYRLLQFVPVLTTVTGPKRPFPSLDYSDEDWRQVRELVYEPENLHWMPFTGNLIESISFRFREPDGREKRFLADAGAHNAILITLRLRPKPKPSSDPPETSKP